MAPPTDTIPRTLDIEGNTFTLRRMTHSDAGDMIKFAKKLPPHDLLFLRRDITKKKVVDAWIASTEEGDIDTLVALEGDEIVGCAALITDPLSWSPHVGEVRVLVANSARKKGLGRKLVDEIFSLAPDHAVRKLTAHMTVDQTGAIAIFEELGFRGEALLKDHVMDGEGQPHDIVVLSCDPERAAAALNAYTAGSGA